MWWNRDGSNVSRTKHKTSTKRKLMLLKTPETPTKTSLCMCSYALNVETPRSFVLLIHFAPGTLCGSPTIRDQLLVSNPLHTLALPKCG